MRYGIGISVLMACAVAWAQETPPLRAAYTHDAMGTVFEFTLYTRPGDAGTDEIGRIAEEAFVAVDELDARLSTWRGDSLVTYVNQHAAFGPVPVSADLIELINYCKNINEQTKGAFDPTVGPLLEIWGFHKKKNQIPDKIQIRIALSRVGLAEVLVDKKERTVHLGLEGMRLDFGAVGKGLALDVAAGVLREHGVTSALLNAGTSTVLALGVPPGEPGWKVRVRDPYDKEKWLDEVVLRDEALSTSGSYEKFVEVDGKKYCHIFDPKTGQPVEDMLSATAIARDGKESDALSTAFFVLGVEKTRAYCRNHDGVRAILGPMAEPGAVRAVRIGFADPEEDSNE